MCEIALSLAQALSVTIESPEIGGDIRTRVEEIEHNVHASLLPLIMSHTAT